MNTQHLTASSQNSQSIRPESSPSILNSPISILNLSVRAYGCLKSVGIITVAQLVGYNIDRLRRIRNMGKKSIADVLYRLNEFDLKLAGSTDTKEFITESMSGSRNISIAELPASVRNQELLFKKLKEAHKLYVEKGSLEAVGKYMGITRERVRQLLVQGTRLGLFEYRPYNYPFAPKEKILEDFRRGLSQNAVARANDITVNYLHKLLTAYNITEEDLYTVRIEGRKLRCIDQYNCIKSELGHHPTTTELQLSQSWRNLNMKIDRLWGSFEVFREELDIPKPPHRYSEGSRRWWEHRQQLALIIRMERLDRIRECLASGPTTLAVIANKSDLANQTVYNLMRLLMATGDVVKEGSGAYTKYRLVS